MSRFLIIPLVAVLFLVPAAGAQERQPVLVDTDIGSDIDDAFALGLVLGSYELDLRGLTTVSGNTGQRAMMLCRWLTMSGRRHTAVASGADPQPARPITTQYQYYYHPDVIFNRTKKPEKEPAVDFLQSRLKGQPGRVTILALGPLTNVARLLADKPDAKGLIRRVVLLENHLKLDVPAAKAVFASGVPLMVVPSDLTKDLKLEAADVKRVLGPRTQLAQQIECLYQLWDQAEPPLGEALAAALCFNESLAKLEEKSVGVDDQGRLAAGTAKARVVAGLEPAAFRKWYVERMASLVSPEQKPVQPVAQGMFPNRVHFAEDYDTDIERRWWMSGKAETKILPPGGLRACRGVLTHDFDDLQMQSRKMWMGVVFNPVPGPPMGQQPHCSFRYWLKGTDSIRVAIYSLTNGYHRQLWLKGLPQEKWQHATVDMRQLRRPDGTGGPLGENERIDDIQFYVDPAAEIIVDDVILYDAAVPGEKRPFPKRILYTGWFDSGKQGKEWPGSFDVVPQQGYFWNAARSVDGPDGQPWIRLHLKGERTLGDATQLFFRYQLKGADSMRVLLLNSGSKQSHLVALKGLKQDAWSDATVDFTASGPRKPKKGDKVDEIHLLVPKGAELLLDDVLLYED